MLILNKEAVNKAFCDLSTLIFRPLYDIGPISVLVNLNTLHNLIPLFNFSWIKRSLYLLSQNLHYIPLWNYEHLWHKVSGCYSSYFSQYGTYMCEVCGLVGVKAQSPRIYMFKKDRTLFPNLTNYTTSNSEYNWEACVFSQEVDK